MAEVNYNVYAPYGDDTPLATITVTPATTILAELWLTEELPNLWNQAYVDQLVVTELSPVEFLVSHPVDGQLYAVVRSP